MKLLPSCCKPSGVKVWGIMRSIYQRRFERPLICQTAEPLTPLPPAQCQAIRLLNQIHCGRHLLYALSNASGSSLRKFSVRATILKESSPRPRP